MVVLAACTLPSLADGKRVALVIGNAAYKHAAELRNPRNDAQDVADALEKLGFTVISGYDLDHAGTRRSIASFAVALASANVAVFYYAGHGIQVAGANYLVPVDSRLDNEYSPEFELIRIDVVQRLMENKRRTNLLFLDACRDNPLARNLARAMGTRSASIGRGLSPTESGIGTLISYSTQPGAVAQDGLGRNSPYAAALVRQLKRDGIAITDMLLDVRRDVMLATHDRQIPWEHSALRDRFYFSLPKPLPVAPPPPPQERPAFELEPPELTPAQKTSLARRLNRELRRVGCDPKARDGSWKEGSQAALQRFLDVTRLALHTDEPTKAALDAVTAQKLLVCPRQVAPAPALVTKPAPAPVVAAPPPRFVAPPVIADPVAATPPATDVAPPAATAAPTPPAVPPAADPLPDPTLPPAAATPPAVATPPKVTPRAVPRAAAVKSLPPPAAPQAPFTTNTHREKTCRLETQAECERRHGINVLSTGNLVCGPIAARKEVCPGSAPAAAKPSFAPTARAAQPETCRTETQRECLIRQNLGLHWIGSRQFCGPDSLLITCK